MSVPINRGTNPISQRVYALIFNGITRASSAATDEADWIRLSERERIAEAVYAELWSGNIEFRLGGLAMLTQVADGQAADEGSSGQAPTLAQAIEAIPTDNGHPPNPPRRTRP